MHSLSTKFILCNIGVFIESQKDKTLWVNEAYLWSSIHESWSSINELCFVEFHEWIMKLHHSFRIMELHNSLM